MIRIYSYYKRAWGDLPVPVIDQHGRRVTVELHEGECIVNQTEIVERVRIEKPVKVGKDAVRSQIKKLEQAGVLVRKRKIPGQNLWIHQIRQYKPYLSDSQSDSHTHGLNPEITEGYENGSKPNPTANPPVQGSKIRQPLKRSIKREHKREEKEKEADSPAPEAGESRLPVEREKKEKKENSFVNKKEKNQQIPTIPHLEQQPQYRSPEEIEAIKRDRVIMLWRKGYYSDPDEINPLMQRFGITKEELGELETA